MMGKHLLDSMSSFFSKTDVLFLSLKDDYIFTLTTPAKLQAYMASGKPVLAMIDGDARSLIEDSQCGIFCKVGDNDIFVPNYADENVSTKIVKLIQSYTGVVNKMVWRKY